jgi:hypothetical protein
VVLGLELRATPWATPPALFCDEYFWDRVSQTIYLSWLWTPIFLISASWVARIAGSREPPVSGLKFLLILFFWWDWGLNSGLRVCKAGTVLFEPHL